MTESSDHPAVTNSVTVHDFLGRVASVLTPVFGGGWLTTSNFYDGASSRLLLVTNPLNQYTNILRASASLREDTPFFDPDGNMTATGDGWRYVWNGENRMVLASNATTVVTYAYDHQGRMVWKQFSRRGAGAQSWEVEKTASLLWDGYNIVHQTITNPQSTITNAYVWGLDLSGSLQGAGGVGGLLAEVKDVTPYFAAFDANGNITEYISTNGLTEAHYEYSPFGEIVAQSGELADAFTHRFSTKPWCGVTGLSEYLFRKYEPGMGRWMSRDPLGQAGGVNNLRFVKNQPVNAPDFLGLVWTKEVAEGPIGIPNDSAGFKMKLKSTFSSHPSGSTQYWQLNYQLVYRVLAVDCSVDERERWVVDVNDIIEDGWPSIDRQEFWPETDDYCYYSTDTTSKHGFAPAGVTEKTGGNQGSSKAGDAIRYKKMMGQMIGPFDEFTVTYKFSDSRSAKCCKCRDKIPGPIFYNYETLSISGLGSWGTSPPSIIIVF